MRRDAKKALLGSMAWAATFCLLFACAQLSFRGAASAGFLNPLETSLRVLAVGCKQIEIQWREDVPVEMFGINRTKKSYRGSAEIRNFWDHLDLFPDLASHTASTPSLDPNFSPVFAYCPHEEHYTHRIRLIRRDGTAIELRYDPQGRIRSALINAGDSAYLSRASARWLEEQVEFKADINRIEAFVAARSKAWEEAHPQAVIPRYNSGEPR